jgi:hypothetical protein
LSSQPPVWLLIDFDWFATKQSAPFIPRLRALRPIGHQKWIPGSPFTGKDNCAWALFTRPSDEPARFYGRSATGARAGARTSVNQ